MHDIRIAYTTRTSTHLQYFKQKKQEKKKKDNLIAEKYLFLSPNIQTSSIN